MRISVIGCGYLGAVHAAAMASLGHDVVGVDVDEAKVAKLSAGETPFFEPGLADILRAGVDSGRLTFSTSFAAASDAQVHFIGVGTPQRKDTGAADLTYVDAAIASLKPHLAPGSLVAGKSTVPVGTAARLTEEIRETGAHLAWNPEFLREGYAVRDTVDPDRLVYGVTEETGEADVALLDEVYASILAKGTPRLVMNQPTAELVKISANSFLATKRKFLNAGVGFGGGCLPKDIRAFAARADELGRGESLAFLREIDEINLRRRQHLVDLVIDSFDGQVFGRRVAVLGLAFKPDSDDIRDSPALDVAVRLKGLGAEVVSYDPEAMDNARRMHPQLAYADSLEAALEGAEAVAIVTEWKQFKELDPAATAARVARPFVFDGRNVLDPVAWREAGWTYTGMGRG